MKRVFDVIVVGGGHAGCEAAHAAMRIGARCALVTHKRDTLGEMSCNPAFGGIGKGTLVREIDALGGVMGIAADAAAIHFRVLNRRRGAAVHGPRVQADRVLYKQQIARLMDGVEIVEGGVDDVITNSLGAISGVRLAGGEEVSAPCVVLATGTFLNGRIHMGPKDTTLAGRIGDTSSVALGDTLRKLFDVARLTTATPPRLDGTTIDYSNMVPQPTEDPPTLFSFMAGDDRSTTHPLQMCYSTNTTEKTKEIIRENAHMLPGIFKTGQGPRYCPSIEAKILKFADRESHQIWIEPEGLPENSNWVYPNGLSTGFPADVQLQIARSLTGLENVEMTRPGYAVEYDYIDPRQIDRGLHTSKIPGLFLAGQINGTTGYEEAGAQGVIAGANAALLALGRDPFVLGRGDALTGVMIDDLVTMGASEPYRMFSSRAEFRLILRHDNADMRLTERGYAVGLVSDERYETVTRKRERLDIGREMLQNLYFPRSWWESRFPCTKGVGRDGRKRSVATMLASVSAIDLPVVRSQLEKDQQDLLHPSILDALEVELKYASYIAKHEKEIATLRTQEGFLFPSEFNYNEMQFLNKDERATLSHLRPKTLGDAGRLSCVRPTSLALLYNHAKNVRSNRLRVQ